MTFDRDITLTTDRLLLRPFTEHDVPDVLEAGRDREMRRWMAWAPNQTPAQAHEFCTRAAHEDPQQKICFAVEAAGRCCGSVSLQRAEWLFGRAEIGYWLAPWARGRGLITEAVRALVDYGFGKGLHRIELLAAVGNEASHRVAERAGFTREAVLREAGVLFGGERTDMVMFARLNRPRRSPG
ncbi:Protein N-acetyltransferase, RimJ/RimL family [Thermomonospora echinospora]|uniref:Protein N-acetyltransferase, RimJ/RimL family n=1 Tax=Thermomonospora echinospora TaxID=1992 RepID=A0A1H6B4M5_9ACTN|nr:GNAT family N-acetyltransferase [Thermomonospora echinospora]SEG55809.1 Protein N-acetyltransferase, RimJ/RimL family [Thermomonospora echinospora]